MSETTIVILYATMMAFDLSVLAGTAYLIAAHDWSVLTLFVAFFICGGSSPRWIIEMWTQGTIATTKRERTEK
jgi:hypothetical protein